jgi:alkanesulfonate monooxygenase SsuD/methylene tetrahydromethanopterin reductase-like flavin-dependent oxidoreductase (luciferase family)
LPDDFEVCLYYNIRVGSDREETIKTSAEYLRAYYGVDYDRDFLERRVAMGDPTRCIDEIGKFIDAGVSTVTLRLVGPDEKEQFARVSEDVLTAFRS